ncbi:MAG: NAD-dependent epimerase/dehydratase family protein [Candidatus Fonsibacter sp.]|nr:NAD-dependent epimerase/dehydratase family protein [Candidatus Fonsibacter sp.]
MKVALIIGGTGQIGVYLANVLLKNRNKVFISSRKITAQKKNKFKIINIYKKIHLIKLNLYKKREILKLINRIKPNSVYYLAGQSSVDKSFKSPRESIRSNFNGCKNVLETLKEINFSGKFLNAASSEMFGNQKGLISLNKKLKPVSPYGKAKLKSFNLTKYYRKKFKLKTYNAVLFNCDSILRPKNFVMPKICLSAIKASQGYMKKIKFGNINIVRDWGWVEEYVEGIYKITQRKPDDVIIASGKYFKLKDLIKYAYNFFNLDWRDHIIETNKLKRPKEIKEVKVNIKQTKKKIGWKAKSDGTKVIRKLIKYYLRKK